LRLLTKLIENIVAYSIEKSFSAAFSFGKLRKNSFSAASASPRIPDLSGEIPFVVGQFDDLARAAVAARHFRHRHALVTAEKVAAINHALGYAALSG
jgi:hypothetical protein